MKVFKNLVGGEWVDAADGAVFENRNPASKDKVLGTFPSATQEDVQGAVAAARKALSGWAAMPPPNRGAILYKASQLVADRLDDMAAVLTREEGKTLAESRAEVARARDILRYYAGEGWRVGGEVLPSNARSELLYTRREPLGVVSVITPWNYPVAIPAWKIAPALAYGNTVVFKPASYAPQVGLMLVEALVEAGLPSGTINYLTGSGSVVGHEMVRNPYVDGVSFTGSYGVGTGIYRETAENMSRVQLVPFQADFDKVSSCATLSANVLWQEERHAQENLHRRSGRGRANVPAGLDPERRTRCSKAQSCPDTAACR
jgi:aldehyde dehydrogenase (NAD+)